MKLSSLNKFKGRKVSVKCYQKGEDFSEEVLKVNGVLEDIDENAITISYWIMGKGIGDYISTASETKSKRALTRIRINDLISIQEC